MVYEINLSGICDPTGLHRKIRATLPIPDWYGNNLDALQDILTEQSSWTVRFINAQGLRTAWPRYTAALERLCQDCGAEIRY